MASARGSNDGPYFSSVRLAALRRFIQEEPAPIVAADLEHCELCGNGILPEHKHLLEQAKRTLLCVCNACAILFDKEGAGDRKYKVVPRCYLALADFTMTDTEWDELMIPVDMAFLVGNSNTNAVSAWYPGPAGATESLLRLTQWETLVQNNLQLQEMACDVEALLINRIRGTRAYYIVPIDACYQLVGLIRSKWRGLSGGEIVWQAITRFFAEIQARAHIVGVEQAMQGGGDAGSTL